MFGSDVLRFSFSGSQVQHQKFLPPSSVGLSSLSRDPSWPLASSQLRREKMLSLLLSIHLLPLLLLPPARLTIASHNIFLRTSNEGGFCRARARAS